MNVYDFDVDEWRDFKDNDRCFKLLIHENTLFTSRVNRFPDSTMLIVANF